MPPLRSLVFVLSLGLVFGPAAVLAQEARLIPAQFFGKLSIDDVPRLRKRAASGDMAAQHLLWTAYRDKPRGGLPPWESSDDIVTRAEAEQGLRQAAGKGDAEAQAILAVALLQGDSVARDPRGAQAWLMRLIEATAPAERGQLDHLLARALIEASDATPEEVARAIQLADEALALGITQAIGTKARALSRSDPAAARGLLEAAVAGNPHAALPLARMLLRGEGGARDVKRAEALLAGDDSHEARAERGRQHLWGGAFARLPQRALTLMSDIATYDIDTRQELARQLLTYRVTFPRPEPIFHALQEDADIGRLGAPLALVRLLRANREGFRDEKLWFDAVRRFQGVHPRIAVYQAEIAGRWAKLGSTEANRALFAREATELLARLEAANVAEAYTLHGDFLAKGIVFRQDDVAAQAMLRKGAELGDTEAMLALASVQEDGRGIPKDRAQALDWLRRAAAAGSVEARKRIAYRFRFDGFDKKITLREGIGEVVVHYGDGHDGAALTAFGGVFANSRLNDFSEAEVAAAILDGMSMSPGAVEEDKLVAMVKQVPQRYWVLIETLLNAEGLLSEPAQGYMGPQARDALRSWVYRVGPPANAPVRGTP